VGISLALEWQNNASSNSGFTVGRAVGSNCYTNNSQCSRTIAANLGSAPVGPMYYTHTFSPLDAVCYFVAGRDLLYTLMAGTDQ